MNEHIKQLDAILKPKRGRKKKATVAKPKKLTKAQQKKLEKEQQKAAAGTSKAQSPKNSLVSFFAASSSTPVVAPPLMSSADQESSTAMQNKGNKNQRRKKPRRSTRYSLRSSRSNNFSDAAIEVIDLIKSPPLLLPGVVSEK